MSLKGYKTRTCACRVWQQCIHWANLTGIRPVISVIQMLERHLEGILSAVVLQTTNALAERIDSCIQRIKRLDCGFRNRERFRRAILLHLGTSSLYPVSLSQS